MTNKYEVFLNTDESYIRVFHENCMEEAATSWAEWYCRYTAEYDSPFECFVRRVEGDKEGPITRFIINITQMPVFEAVEAE